MKISSIGIGIVSAALLCGQASAIETTYGAGARAFPLQQAGGTARSKAMGSATVAVPDGSASVLENPAGLSRMSCTELGFHHLSGLGEINQEVGVFGMPVGRVKDCDTLKCQGGGLGGIAASFGYVNYGSFDGRDALGVHTGDYRASDWAGSVGWGMEVLPRIAAGIAVKAYHSNLAAQGYESYSTDVGVLWKAASSLDLGATYSNINLGKKVGGNFLASGWRLGAGWSVYKHWLLSAAGELQDKAVDRIQLGTEYLVGNVNEKSSILALRAGYAVNYPSPDLDGLVGLTLGLGYTMSRNIILDYAFLPVGELGSSHRLSLTFKFGCPEKPEPPAAAAPVAPTPVAAVVVPPVRRPVVPPPPPPIVLKAIFLEDSHFDFDKSTLRPEGMEALMENVELLKDNPKSMVRVEGYTSMSGTEEYNQLLSERRAVAVETFLVAQGIAPRRISTIGYGEMRPATYEDKPGKINSAAAKSNMRVLFEVTVK